MTPLERDLRAQLERTQASGIKRPQGLVKVGQPDDEPKAEAAARPGGVKVPNAVESRFPLVAHRQDG